MSLISYLRERVDEVLERLFARRPRYHQNVYDREHVRLSEITANDRNGEGM
jgi:hypothetical protein